METPTSEKKKEIVLTPEEKQQIAVKFFDYFVKKNKVVFPTDSYEIVKLSKKFDVDKDKLAMFIIITINKKMLREGEKVHEQMEMMKNYFNLK
jgi:hypothetical protein